MMMLLKCPSCKNQMKYESRAQVLADNVKRCVYCGHSFKVRASIVKQVS